MKQYEREVQAPPESICTGGICHMGTFNGPIRNINIQETEKPLGRSFPRFLNTMRLKEWQAFQIADENWFICLAVYNAKATGIIVIMAYSIKEQKMYRYERKVAPWQLHVPRGLEDSRCYYYSRNFNIDIHNHLKDNKLELEFSAWNFKGLPDIRGSFRAFHITEPIVIVQPFGENRPLYSHKALMPAEGILTVGEKDTEMTVSDCGIILDDHKGFYPGTMKYDWVTTMGFTPEGKRIGFNLTDNQVQDHERYNENCLWLDGRMIPLPPVHFTRPEGVMGPWKVQDEYNMVDLVFHPGAEVPIVFNLGVASSDYHGVFGTFSGTLRTPEGGEYPFRGFAGMGEQKCIRM